MDMCHIHWKCRVANLRIVFIDVKKERTKLFQVVYAALKIKVDPPGCKTSTGHRLFSFFSSPEGKAEVKRPRRSGTKTDWIRLIRSRVVLTRNRGMRVLIKLNLSLPSPMQPTLR